MYETDVPTECAQARKDPRLSQAHVDEGRTCSDQGAPGEGSPTPVGVSSGPPPVRAPDRGVGRIRSRHTFEELRRSGVRGRSGPLTVSFVRHPEWPGPELAYAITRRAGNAVTRNRLRRRLRAIVSEQAPTLPAGAYVVSTGPGGPLFDFDELKVAMGQALEKATRHRAAHHPGAPAEILGAGR